MTRFENIQGCELTVHLSARSKYQINQMLDAGCFKGGAESCSNETVLSSVLNMAVDQLFTEAIEKGKVKR
jgi:hypothetical protein